MNSDIKEKNTHTKKPASFLFPIHIAHFHYIKARRMVHTSENPMLMAHAFFIRKIKLKTVTVTKTENVAVHFHFYPISREFNFSVLILDN